MLSDAQKKTLARAAELLRLMTGAVESEFDGTDCDIMKNVPAARDAATALDAMINPPKRNGHVHEVGSCECDKPGFNETEMA